MNSLDLLRKGDIKVQGQGLLVAAQGIAESRDILCSFVNWNKGTVLSDGDSKSCKDSTAA